MIKNHNFFYSFEGWKIDINAMLVWNKWIGINAIVFMGMSRFHGENDATSYKSK